MGEVIEVAAVETPLGAVTVAVHRGRLCRLAFAPGGDCVGGAWRRWLPPGDVRLVDDPAGVARALREYFAGRLGALDGLEPELHGTPFQRAVWEAIREVPPGETVTYGEVARRVGRPAAARAVGSATGANPVALVVPCHRIVPAAGGIGRYGGGVERKRWLLAHEGALRQRG